MNKVSNTIGWADFSWNPISGCHGECDYCYARRIYNRFKKSFIPTFHKDRLEEPKKIHGVKTRIFVCSVADFWGKGVLLAWRKKVYKIMEECPQHQFFILTKQPQRILKTEIDLIPLNVWVGVSVSRFEDRWRPATLMTLGFQKTFISIEPLLGELSDYFLLPDWIIVGALTGPGSLKFRPKKKIIKEIIVSCGMLRKPSFIKDNVGHYKNIKQFPDLLK